MLEYNLFGLFNSILFIILKIVLIIVPLVIKIVIGKFMQE